MLIIGYFEGHCATFNNDYSKEVPLKLRSFLAGLDIPVILPPHVTPHVTPQVEQQVTKLKVEISRQELQEALEFANRK